MRQAVVALVLMAVLGTAAAACTDAQVPDELGELGELSLGGQEFTDQDRFCLAVTRVTTAVESGSPVTAQEAAEELLAQAPDDLTAEARAVAFELRRVLADDRADLRDDELGIAIDRLRDGTLARCEPD